MKPINSQQGYTLLFAVLLTSMILSVSVSILSISQKEVILSTSARDSQSAFYAADSILECAYFWNLEGEFEPDVSGSQMSCNGQTINMAKSTPSGTVTEYSMGNNSYMYLKMLQGNTGDASKPCATVKVTKETIGVAPDTGVKTTIDARGYNTCVSTPRRVERGYRITF